MTTGTQVGGSFGTTAGAFIDASLIDHGALSGLTDDDHPDYFRADGSRAISGSIVPDAAGTVNIGSATNYLGDVYTASTRYYGADAHPMRIDKTMGGTSNEHPVLQIQSTTAGRGAIVQILPASDVPATGQINSELLLFNIVGDNYERFALTWFSSEVIIDTTAQGTGTVRPITFAIGSTTMLRLWTDSKIYIGSSSNDTNFYRAAAGVLATDHTWRIGTADGTGSRNALQLLADAPRAYWGAGSLKPSFKVAAQDSHDSTWVVGVSTSNGTDPTALTYTEVFGVRSTGVDVLTGTLKMAGVQVLTTQQAAIADHASDATVNSILAALRTHGLIAT